MQTRNKIFDDLSELMTNALGVAQGAKDEADTAVRGVIDRWLADKDLVSREELEVLKIMFEKLGKENADLKSRLEILEKQKNKIVEVERTNSLIEYFEYQSVQALSQSTRSEYLKRYCRRRSRMSKPHLR